MHNYNGLGEPLIGITKMLDKNLAEKIIEELSRFSIKKYAVTNSFGEVLAKGENFSVHHNPLDIKGKRALPLNFDKEKVGYLFVDENLAIVQEIGGVLKSMVELIVHQNFYASILTSDEKRVDQLIYDLLKSEGMDQRELRQTLLSFGIDINKDRLTVLVEIADPAFLFLNQKELVVGEREKKIARVKREIKYMLSSFYTHHKDNVVAYLGANNFVILKDMGDNPNEYEEEFRKTLNSLYYNLKNELRSEITVGVGGFKNSINSVRPYRESYEEAQTAINFGKQTWGRGKIFHFDTFGVVAPLFSGVTGRNITFSKEIINKLSKYPELLESLRAYFELDISLSKTAKRLKIHRNTLVYRLEKIAEITELDPREFNDAFQLQIALILDKYSG